MPAASSRLAAGAATALAAFGEAIKQRRNQLGYSMVDAAAAAGVSRVTLHRIERGNPSVTIGAYMNAASALGLRLTASPDADSPPEPNPEKRIHIKDYPQLSLLAWNLRQGTVLSDDEALSLYERNWRHVDQTCLTAAESALIRRLTRAAGHEGRLLV
jgi:transcriptional regulator with XRE-family HTH domain